MPFFPNQQEQQYGVQNEGMEGGQSSGGGEGVVGPVIGNPVPADPGAGEEDFSEMENLYPYTKSYGGLPPWGSDLIKKYMEQYMTPYAQSLQESLNEISNAPALIEQTRQNMVNQYLDTNLRPVISNLAGRGVLSSSTAEGAIGNVGNEAQNRADVWAGNALLANLEKKAEAYQKQMALMNQLLELAKYSESEGANPLAPWELIFKNFIQD